MSPRRKRPAKKGSQRCEIRLFIASLRRRCGDLAASSSSSSFWAPPAAAGGRPAAARLRPRKSHPRRCAAGRRGRPLAPADGGRESSALTDEGGNYTLKYLRSDMGGQGRRPHRSHQHRQSARRPAGLGSGKVQRQQRIAARSGRRQQRVQFRPQHALTANGGARRLAQRELCSLRAGRLSRAVKLEASPSPCRGRTQNSPCRSSLIRSASRRPAMATRFGHGASGFGVLGRASGASSGIAPPRLTSTCLSTPLPSLAW